MIDPITAFSAASMAFSGLKKAISVGKDITSMGSTLSTWSKAVSDMDFLDEQAKKPPMYKMFSDTQASALDIWTKKQKMAEMREELRAHISWTYGPTAWKEIVRIEAQQRKAQRELVYQKQEFIDNCINWGVGLVATIIGGALLALAIYFIGKSQGKW